MSKREVRKVRDETFSNFDFTVAVLDGVEKPQCILCSKMLSTSSLKSWKLQEHFMHKPSMKGKERQHTQILKKEKAQLDNKRALLNLVKSHSTLDEQLL